MSQTQKFIKLSAGVLVEALEGRQLLSGSGVEVVDPLSAHISLDNGVVTITGTNDADEVEIGSDVDGGIYARVSRLDSQFKMVEQWSEHFAAGEVQSIVASGGNGDDALYVMDRSTLIGMPVTLKGGNGNDMLHAEQDRDWKDAKIWLPGMAGTSTVLEGGNGDDELWGGVGDSTLIGGAGDDRYAKWYGAVVIIEDAPAPKPPAPVVVTPVEVVDVVEPVVQPVVVKEEQTNAPVVLVSLPKNVFSAAPINVNTPVFSDSEQHLWA